MPAVEPPVAEVADGAPVEETELLDGVPVFEEENPAAPDVPLDPEPLAVPPIGDEQQLPARISSTPVRKRRIKLESEARTSPVQAADISSGQITKPTKFVTPWAHYSQSYVDGLQTP